MDEEERFRLARPEWVDDEMTMLMTEVNFRYRAEDAKWMLRNALEHLTPGEVDLLQRIHLKHLLKEG